MAAQASYFSRFSTNELMKAEIVFYNQYLEKGARPGLRFGKMISHKAWKKSQIPTNELLKMEIAAHDQALGR